jgi:dihydrofolate synthase/folylpolyglutamate synthase
MNIDEALNIIDKAEVFGANLNCDRALHLYRHLGDPWRHMESFHVACTNGKGSISSYLTHILCQAGHKVGWYTSPYLIRFNERIRVLDGPADLARYDVDLTTGEIPDTDVVRLMGVVGKTAEKVHEEIGQHVTQFDMITAVAFLWFKEQGCDYAVLETGLGGRLDSTNILEKPIATMMASPGYDHMDRLGNTMAEIMSEKAGVIKRGTPVYAYNPSDALLSQDDAADARRVLEERCRAVDAPLTFVGHSDIEVLDYGREGQKFRSRHTGREYSTKLLGPYQPIYAMQSALAVAHAGLADSEAIRRGIETTVWPARLEVLSRSPFVLLDGAHNLQGMLGLKEALSRLSDGDPIVFLIGLFADKDYEKMLRALLTDSMFKIAGIVATEPPSERKLDAETLAKTAERIMVHNRGETVVIAEADIDAAMEKALRMAEEKKALICACGSLYLASGVKSAVHDLLG